MFRATRVLIIMTAILPLQGCFFVFIPGSVISGISDSVTGAEGTHCVGANAKVGDTIRLPGDGRATVKSLSGTSVRCTNPEMPIRALLEFPDSNSARASSRSVAQSSTNPNPANVKASLSLPDGWERRPLSDSQVTNGAIFVAINRTTDTGVLFMVNKRQGIGDLMEFAKSKGAAQASQLADAQQHQISEITVNGKRAMRFDVSGTLKSGVKITYMMTMLEGTEEIAIVYTWTSTANYENQRDNMGQLAGRVAGI